MVTANAEQPASESVTTIPVQQHTAATIPTLPPVAENGDDDAPVVQPVTPTARPAAPTAQANPALPTARPHAKSHGS